ncbi:hypothetical protein YC2023_024161 [Brassica napus]
MPSGTRSNKEKDFLFSDDPAHLEGTIRRGQRSASLDANTSSSIDTHNQPSTDTRPSSSIDPNRSTTIDTTPRTSIDTVSSKMVNIIILTQDENGNLYDQAGHLRNATGQKIDAQGTVIPDADATGAPQPVDKDARSKPLADYNRPDEYYSNRSAIRLPEIQKQNFELKPQYYTLVSQIPYSGLPHEHPMDHLERFEDLIAAIRMEGVPEDYLLCKLFRYTLNGEAMHWLRQQPTGSLTSWSDIKNALLRNFFDEARAEELRNKISTFSQKAGESFKDAWIRFRFFQRDCPHHGFNEVQLLSTFFRGLALQYQMALDTASDGNFTTRNPLEAVRLIENLANSSSTKNTDSERKKSVASIGKEQMDEVRAKLDVVHELLRKQVCSAEGEVADTEGEEDVNYIGRTGFQKFGNQGGNRNFFGNGQRSNQSSQFQKPFNNIKSYSNSYYQNPSPQTQESKIEEMLDRVLLGQQQITVDFNGKIDSAYNNLNTKIETLGTQVRKIETQVIQTRETMKRQEAFAREAGADKGKHHVNAIIDDEFWQVVRNENLEEGDFEIESSMSLGGSQWCRPMSMNSHRSTDHDEDRWTDYSSHRSTSSAKSTECNAVRILTHEEFAAKHPHPPCPFYEKIDRSVNSTIDRQSESDIDRHNTPPIDRQAPLTYRVRLPSIDNDYINALRPPPKPLANPPEPKPQPFK